MSDSEEEEEQRELCNALEKWKEHSLKAHERFQVSGWDNDTDGIEVEANPHESPDKELLWAAEKGRADIVKRIVSSDPSLVHTTDKDGYTPLHRAAYSDHPYIVEYLLKHGARHDAATEDNWQPLHSAAKWNNVRCAAILIANGADVNAVSNGGVTPLHLAAGHSRARELIILLLGQREISPEEVDQAGDTPLDIARRSGHNDVLFEMIEPCFL